MRNSSPGLTPRRARHKQIHKRQRHPLLQAAKRLAACYSTLTNQQPGINLSTLQGRAGENIERHRHLEGLLCRAERLGYRHAAEALMQRCRRSLGDLEYFIASHAAQLRRPKSEQPSLKSLHQELVAVEDEFGDVEFDRWANVVAVTTPPIVFDGLDLGRFRIELHLDEMASDAVDEWYRIEALDPNPPSSDEDVTHPHVQSSRLCAGDAVDSIRDTLSSGRLCEFFMVVRSVLETYNDNSPYVSIEDWEGRRCIDCDDIVSREDAIDCASCHREFCENCAGTCIGCSIPFCLNCLRDSEVSGEMFCEGCIRTCAACEAAGGRGEFLEDLCPGCHERQNAEREPVHREGPSPPSSMPSQSPPRTQEPINDSRSTQFPVEHDGPPPTTATPQAPQQVLPEASCPAKQEAFRQTRNQEESSQSQSSRATSAAVLDEGVVEAAGALPRR